jgi:hypothetical protein
MTNSDAFVVPVRSTSGRGRSTGRCGDAAVVGHLAEVGARQIDPDC